MQRYRWHIRGFSLLEVAISLFLLGLVVYVGLTALPHLWIAGQRGNDALAASETMQSALEALRARPFEELDVTEWRPMEVESGVSEFKIQVRYRVLRAPDPRLSTDEVKVVEVEGRWRDARREVVQTRQMWILHDE